MLVASHKQIGLCVSTTIEDKLGVKLALEELLYGCELPDISAAYLLKPHFKKYSFNFILKAINSLMIEYNYEQENDKKQFSLKLGIIIHYIADYFCYAHNHMQFNFFPLHIIYEYSLAHEFNRYTLNDVENSKNTNINFENLTSINHIKNYINRKHDEYMSLPFNIINDINYAVEVCTTVACAIIFITSINYSNYQEIYDLLTIKQVQ